MTCAVFGVSTDSEFLNTGRKLDLGEHIGEFLNTKAMIQDFFEAYTKFTFFFKSEPGATYTQRSEASDEGARLNQIGSCSQNEIAQKRASREVPSPLLSTVVGFRFGFRAHAICVDVVAVGVSLQRLDDFAHRRSFGRVLCPAAQEDAAENVGRMIGQLENVWNGHVDVVVQVPGLCTVGTFSSEQSHNKAYAAYLNVTEWFLPGQNLPNGKAYTSTPIVFFESEPGATYRTSKRRIRARTWCAGRLGSREHNISTE